MAISLSSLDLSFLGKPKDFKPVKGRFRTDKTTGESVTVQEWHRRNPPVRNRGTVPLPYFAPDVDAAYGGAWKSIIDGSEISSRSNWREHNKRNEVLEVGPGYWGETAERDICDITAEKAGYDPSLIGDPSFSWVDPRI